MLVLAIDTALSHGTVGVVEFEGTDPNRVVRAGNLFLGAYPGHAERLLGRIGEGLAGMDRTINDVDLLALGQGPGTFTGLRIGYATAKGLNLAVGIPIVGVSTLEMIAASTLRLGRVVALIDARRGELYMGAFEVRLGNGGWPTAWPLESEQLVKPADVAVAISGLTGNDPLFFAGDGVGLLDKRALSLGQTISFGLSGISGTVMARRAALLFFERGGDDPQRCEPVYLRAPDAKLPAVPLW